MIGNFSNFSNFSNLKSYFYIFSHVLHKIDVVFIQESYN